MKRLQIWNAHHWAGFGFQTFVLSNVQMRCLSMGIFRVSIAVYNDHQTNYLSFRVCLREIFRLKSRWFGNNLLPTGDSYVVNFPRIIGIAYQLEEQELITDLMNGDGE